MILDERNEFCDATALPTATGLSNVGDVIDLGAARDLGNGEPLYLVIQVTTAVTSAGAATVSFTLASDASETIATDGSATTHTATAAIGKASLIAGYTLVMPLPSDGSNAWERYVGVQSNVGTAALTAGAINAFLTTTPQTWKAYPDAI